MTDLARTPLVVAGRDLLDGDVLVGYYLHRSEELWPLPAVRRIVDVRRRRSLGGFGQDMIEVAYDNAGRVSTAEYPASTRLLVLR